MPAPNDIEIVRAYTRRVDGTIADVQFMSAENFEVVVECEGGSAISGSGSPYRIGVTVRNLTDSSILPHNDTEAGVVNWPDGTYQTVFPSGGGGYTPVPGEGQYGVHCYEVIAWLRVRPVDPDVSFARSPIFLVYHHD